MTRITITAFTLIIMSGWLDANAAEARELPDLQSSQAVGIQLLQEIAGESEPDPVVSLTTVGELFARSQSQRVEPPWDSFPFTTETMLDLESRAVVVDESLTWPNFVARTRTMYQPAHPEPETFSIDLNRDVPIPPWVPDQTWLRAQFLVPAVLAHEALRRPDAVRHLGRVVIDGTDLDVVEAEVERERVRVYTRDGSLRRVERLVYSDLNGDEVERTTLLGTQRIGRFSVPESVERTLNGRVVARFEIEPGPEPALERFRAPAGDDHDLTPSPSSPPFLESLAKDVWIVRNIGGADYNSLVVRQSAGLVVVETPQSVSAMEEAAGLVEESLGEKIHAAVVTHHHYDHAGGAWALISRQATLYVPVTSERLFRRAAMAPRTLSEDAVRPLTTAPRIEPVGTRAVIGAEGDPEVVVLAVEENEHSESMLAAWLPEERILFQGDLFVKRGETLEPARPQAEALLSLIEAHSLDPRMIIGVHGVSATVPELRESIRMSRESKEP